LHNRIIFLDDQCPTPGKAGGKYRKELWEKTGRPPLVKEGTNYVKSPDLDGNMVADAQSDGKRGAFQIRDGGAGQPALRTAEATLILHHLAFGFLPCRVRAGEIRHTTPFG